MLVPMLVLALPARSNQHAAQNAPPAFTGSRWGEVVRGLRVNYALVPAPL
jgi:hypothetical protein